MTQKASKLLSIKEVQDRLNISDESVYRLIRSGELKAIRIGNLWRVSEEALQGFLAGASTILKVVCMYCKADMGEKDGQGVSGVSHGICRGCWEERYPDQDYGKV